MSTVNKYPKPVPEAKQRKARLRRVRQQWWRGEMSTVEYTKVIAQIEKETK